MTGPAGDVTAVAPARPKVPTVWLVFITAALMGGNYVALKEGLEHASPLALSAMRAGMGGLALLAFALVRREPLPRSRRAWTAVAVSSLTITTLSSVLLVMGTARIPSGLAALLSATMPLFATFLGVVLLGERPDPAARLGLGVGVVGAVVLASPALDGRTSLAGVVLMLAATCMWGVGVVLQKRLDLSEVSAVTFVACQLLISSVCVGVVALAVEGSGRVELGTALLVPLAISAIPCMAVPFSLVATVLRRAPAYQGAAVAYLIPLFGVLAAWLIRHERLAAAELAGGALVVVGVVLVNRPRPGPAPVPARPVSEASRVR